MPETPGSLLESEYRNMIGATCFFKVLFFARATDVFLRDSAGNGKAQEKLVSKSASACGKI